MKPSHQSTTHAVAPLHRPGQANISRAATGGGLAQAQADNRVAIAYQHCQKRRLVRRLLLRHNAARRARRKEKTMEASKFPGGYRSRSRNATGRTPKQRSDL
jgi:hypothetical protein